MRSRVIDCTNNKFFPCGLIVSTKTKSNKAEFEEHKSDIILKLIALHKYRPVPPPTLLTLFDEITTIGSNVHLVIDSVVTLKHLCALMCRSRCDRLKRNELNS